MTKSKAELSTILLSLMSSDSFLRLQCLYGGWQGCVWILKSWHAITWCTEMPDWECWSKSLWCYVSLKFWLTNVNFSACYLLCLILLYSQCYFPRTSFWYHNIICNLVYVVFLSHYFENNFSLFYEMKLGRHDFNSIEEFQAESQCFAHYSQNFLVSFPKLETLYIVITL